MFSLVAKTMLEKACEKEFDAAMFCNQDNVHH